MKFMSIGLTLIWFLALMVIFFVAVGALSRLTTILNLQHPAVARRIGIPISQRTEWRTTEHWILAYIAGGHYREVDDIEVRRFGNIARYAFLGVGALVVSGLLALVVFGSAPPSN